MEKPTEQQLSTYRDYLANFVVFTEEEWRLFSSHLSFKTLKKKSFFIEEGQICKEIGFILKGAVRYFSISDGEEITGYFSFQNELVSAYKSFLKQSPTISNIEALEQTELITFTFKGLQSLLNDKRINYKMERFGRLVAEAFICCYEDRVQSFITETAEERYLNLIKHRSDIIERIPQHYIANYLGITAVSLSRIRSRIMKPSASLIDTLT